MRVRCGVFEISLLLLSLLLLLFVWLCCVGCVVLVVFLKILHSSKVGTKEHEIEIGLDVVGKTFNKYAEITLSFIFISPKAEFILLYPLSLLTTHDRFIISNKRGEQNRDMERKHFISCESS